MTVELRPLGVTCNLQCQYCYQHPLRDAGNLARRYDMEKMKAGIRAEGGPFVLFGGEPLLLPKPDLRELWAWGLETFGRNAVQTNATLIDDDHIEMFRRYKVQVGVSIDGPGPLNDGRWYGTLERTRAATARSQVALDRLCAEGFAPSLILTLQARNARPELLPRLLEWVSELATKGLGSLGLHLLESESDTVSNAYGLSLADNIAAMRAFLQLSRVLPGLRIQPFIDMRKMLAGNDDYTTCIWNGCDPYNTKAVQGVEGDGQRSNCGRTNKDGIDFEKSRGRGMERSLALYQTPQSCGGCQGCRFFLMCKGQCPGTAVDRDWRNRSEHCEVWKALYSDLEKELEASGRHPLSQTHRRAAIELSITRAWARGEEVKISHHGGHDVSEQSAAQQAAKPNAASTLTPSGRAFADSLEFSLPDFTRISWVHARARQIWEERFRRIRSAWGQVEWRSVAMGLRVCAQVPASAGEPPAARTLAEHGLRVYQLADSVVIGEDLSVAAFADAKERGDDDAAGRLLGYPTCCRRFYRRFQVEQGLSDLTWPMAIHSHVDPRLVREAGLVTEPQSRVVAGHLHANILWRALGVRAVPHVPCSFDCQSTATVGERMCDLMRQTGFDEELAWLEEVLDWPVEWSALHGIAEVKTPVLKLATRTHATSSKYIVRRLGGSYPPEGARGVRFPYRRGRARVTSSAAYARGLAHATRELPHVPVSRPGSAAG